MLKARSSHTGPSCPIWEMGQKTLRVTDNVKEVKICLVRLQLLLPRAPAWAEAAASIYQTCIQLPQVVTFKVFCPISRIKQHGQVWEPLACNQHSRARYKVAMQPGISFCYAAPATATVLSPERSTAQMPAVQSVRAWPADTCVFSLLQHPMRCLVQLELLSVVQHLNTFLPV